MQSTDVFCNAVPEKLDVLFVPGMCRHRGALAAVKMFAVCPIHKPV